MSEIILNGQDITIFDVISVSRYHYQVKLGKEAINRINEASLYVSRLVEDNKVVYGITKGYGVIENKSISKKDTARLQENLLRVMLCGIGEPLNMRLRAMMLLRINSLIKGNSGIRLEVLDLMIRLLNLNIIPYVYSQGSLGSSGDLVPLAHMALPLIGEGEVIVNKDIISTLEAFKKYDLQSITLVAKEGLALINGTGYDSNWMSSFI